MVRQLPRRIRLFVFSGTPRDFVERCFRFAFKKPPGIYIGRFLLRLLPASYKSRAYDISPTERERGFLGAIIGPALDWHYYSMSEEERRKFNREKNWGGQAGKKWHETTKQAFQLDATKYTESESFLKFRRPLVRQISELLSSNPNYHTVCEIGTGSGMFLDYLSREFSNVKRFVGIDLNRQQIQDNKKTYKDSKLEFVHAEIADWVSNQSEKGIVFVTVNVFEYFSQEEFQETLKLIHEKISPVAIAISEPISIDLNHQVISKSRGATAYSHNYPYLFKQYGYDIFRQELQHVNPDIPFYDELIMVATA